MSVHHLLPTTNDAREPGAGLLDALQQGRDTAWTATSERHVPERRAIDADRATIERAMASTTWTHSPRRHRLLTRWP